jgi:hypothetical protein
MPLPSCRLRGPRRPQGRFGHEDVVADPFPHTVPIAGKVSGNGGEIGAKKSLFLDF